jgi:Zn-dependent M16 (insulinase) family peptidase
MFNIVEELFHGYVFSDLARLKSLLLEYRASLEAMVVQNGHRLAISLASRNFSDSRYLNEIWNGVHQLQTIKTLTADMSKDRLGLFGEKLVEIGNTVLKPGYLKMALIGEENALAGAGERAAGLTGDQGRDKRTNDSADIGFEKNQLPREGWGTSTAVSFVAQTFKTVRMNHDDAPALSVISKLLRSLYLHREIREKGGAYGGFAVYNPEDGLFGFGSYRDPHIVGTIQVYNGVKSFLQSGKYDAEDIKEAVLQVCSEIDKPDPPGPAARKAFYRGIISLTDEMRLAFKKNLLLVDVKQVQDVAGKYFSDNGKDRAVAVISGEEKLKEANRSLGDTPLALYRI